LQDERGRDARKSIAATLSRVGRKGEAFSSDPFFRNAFQNEVRRRDLVVLGYSGSDDYDVLPMISLSGSQRRLIWFWHDERASSIQVLRSTGFREQIDAGQDPFRKILGLGNWHPSQFFVVVGRTSELVSKVAEIVFRTGRSLPVAEEHVPSAHFYSKWRIKNSLEAWRSLAFVGDYYQSVGRYLDANAYYSAALVETRELEELPAAERLLLELSSVSIRAGRPDLALQYLDEIESLLREERTTARGKLFQKVAPIIAREMKRFHLHRAICQAELGRWDEAERVLESYETTAGTADQALKLYEQARIAYSRGENANALRKAEDAARIHSARGNLNSLSICTLFRAGVSIEEQDVDAARSLLDKVDRICVMTNNLDVMRRCEVVRARIGT
jgi:tetratricopeptide (TPR) repeat protein